MCPVFASAALSVLAGSALTVPEPDPKAQKIAVERIERLRGQVGNLETDRTGRVVARKWVNFVWLSRTQVTDDDLKVFRVLPRVERVWMVSCPRISDRGLEHLRGARKLWWLDISDTPITDKGLEHLRGHTGMLLLEMFSTRITDDGLVHLKGMKRLNTLDLSDTRVTDKGLEHLRELPKLRTLWLFNTRVTDEGVKHLQAALPELEVHR